MKVYVTKWALTKGILVVDGEPQGREHFLVRGAVPWQSWKFGLGDWHTSREKAILRAGNMRDAKVAQLEKQAAALREMTFDVAELI